MKSQNRDLELEAIVGNMLISQYQTRILKSRIADRLDEWWILSQDRGRNSSSFTFDRHGKEFKVPLQINKTAPNSTLAPKKLPLKTPFPVLWPKIL